MTRLGLVVIVGVVAGTSAATAFAADTYGGQAPLFRPAYNLEWAEEDSLDFEVGLRYWYSHGSTTVGNHWAEDTVQSGEIHFRIDDWSTATYARGLVGYSAAVEGSHGFGAFSEDYTSGALGYARADLGYNLFQTDTTKVSLFAGYDYRNQYAFDTGLDVHALRLGVSARAQFNEVFDLYAELAGVPYAYGYGYGDLGEADGAFYGFSGELMAGFEPGPNVLVRAGLRADYLSGPTTLRATGDVVQAEYFRWGPLVELTYAF